MSAIAHPAPTSEAKEPWYRAGVTRSPFPWLLLLNLGLAVLPVFLFRYSFHPQGAQAAALAERFPEAREVRIARFAAFDERGDMLDHGRTVYRFVRGDAAD